MSFLLFIVFLLTIVANPRIKLSVCQPSPTGITLDLVHRDHISSPQLSRAERLKQMFYRDRQRVESMSRNNVGSIARRQTLEDGNPNALTTMASDYGITEYIVKLMVGTPPQDVLMVPDTGSVLNILRCDYKGKNMPEGPLFYAGKSTSFTGLSCEGDFCSKNLTFLATYSNETVCDYSNTTCAYSHFGYISGLSTSGIFANESFTFTQPNKEDIVLKNMLIGCSTSGQNLSQINGTHGILGLGNFPLSFPTQASKMFGTKFSMCLVDYFSSLSTSSGFFVLGTVPEDLLPPTMSYTQLDSTSLRFQRLYGLNVNAVYINGVPLDITNAIWNNMNPNGGIVVDTGKSLTYLISEAYVPIMDALNKSLSQLMNRVDGGNEPFEYCYDSSKGYDVSLVPKMEIEFKDGEIFQPPLKNYLINVTSEMQCLGFMLEQAMPYSTIGNILLQQHFVEFDVAKNLFGFGKSNCTSNT